MLQLSFNTILHSEYYLACSQQYQVLWMQRNFSISVRCIQLPYVQHYPSFSLFFAFCIMFYLTSKDEFSSTQPLNATHMNSFESLFPVITFSKTVGVMKRHSKLKTQFMIKIIDHNLWGETSDVLNHSDLVVPLFLFL